MRALVIDSVGCNAGDAGRPAQFSGATLGWMRARGHQFAVLPAFDAAAVAAVPHDVVWSEWANEDAFRAAASSACRRLILRVRGYELFSFDFSQMTWSNVAAVVHESEFLKQLAADLDVVPPIVPQHVIPGGVDLARFAPASPGHADSKVVAMLGRADAGKGYQLALEWARRRPDITLHVALSGGDPRVAIYMEQVKTPNVVLHAGPVDTPEWLTRVRAGSLLSASHWETLGYTIVEALAMGIRPLVHTRPGTEVLWPFPTWASLDELDGLLPARQNRTFEIDARVDADRLREWVAARYDVEVVAPRFVKLLEGS
jgi:glycosyltransferase involved in cell wall biosynthesis